MAAEATAEVGTASGERSAEARVAAAFGGEGAGTTLVGTTKLAPIRVPTHV